MMKTVSVVINTWNSAGTLKRAIDSVLSQTYREIELIIFDNCSDDGTFAVVSGIGDKRLKYYSSEIHVCLGEARRRAVEFANGGYIAFCDADDWWHPEKVATQIHWLKSGRFEFSATDFMVVDSYRGCSYRKYPGRKWGTLTLTKLLLSYDVGFLTFMSKTDIVRRVISDEADTLGFIWDRDLVTKVASISEGCFIPTPLAYNTVHGSSLTSRRRMDMAAELCDWVNRLREKQSFAQAGLVPKIIISILLDCCSQGSFKQRLFYEQLRALRLTLRYLQKARYLIQCLLEKCVSKFDTVRYLSFRTQLSLPRPFQLPVPVGIHIGFVCSSEHFLYDRITEFMLYSKIFSLDELSVYSNWRLYYAMDPGGRVLHVTVVHLEASCSPYGRTFFRGVPRTNESYLSGGFTIPSYRAAPVSLLVLSTIFSDLRDLGIVAAYNIVHPSTRNAPKYFLSLGFTRVTPSFLSWLRL